MLRRTLPAVPALLFGWVLAGSAQAPRAADLVLRGGSVYPMDAARSRAEAIAVGGGKILYVGSDVGVADWIGPGTHEDRAGDRGELNESPDHLRALVERLDGEGFQLHVHAIGDRAIRTALDAIEAAQQANGRRDLRHHIAHIQLFDPVDVPRFRELGVVANFQPLRAYAGGYITELTEPVLGPERSRWLHPIGSVVRSGAMMVGGSDWSVSSMNPLHAIQVAVTRADRRRGGAVDPRGTDLPGPGDRGLHDQRRVPRPPGGDDRIAGAWQGRGPGGAGSEPLRNPPLRDPPGAGAHGGPRR